MTAMSVVHLHLALTHLPVIGVPFVFGLLVLGWWRKSRELVWVASVALVVLAVASAGLYLTGEGAEDAVEGLSGVSSPLTERHEDASLVSLVLVGASGAVGLLFLVLGGSRRADFPRAFAAALALAALVASVSLAFTANLGGQIRHSEIRKGAASATTHAPETGDTADDDD